jgi:hypothetical protein
MIDYLEVKIETCSLFCFVFVLLCFVLSQRFSHHRRASSIVHRASATKATSHAKIVSKKLTYRQTIETDEKMVLE